MALGMELGLGPGDIVLDWDPAAPFPKGGGRSPPICTVVIGRPVLKFKFYCFMHSIFRKKSLIVLSLFQYKY